MIMTTASPFFLTMSLAVARSSAVCASVDAAQAKSAIVRTNVGERIWVLSLSGAIDCLRGQTDSRARVRPPGRRVPLFPGRLELDEHRADAALDFEDDRRRLPRLDVLHARLEVAHVLNRPAIQRQDDVAAGQMAERRP